MCLLFRCCTLAKFIRVSPRHVASAGLLYACSNYFIWLLIMCLKETNQPEMEFSSANVCSVSLMGLVWVLGVQRVQRCIRTCDRGGQRKWVKICLTCQFTCMPQEQEECLAIWIQRTWWAGSSVASLVKYSGSVRVMFFKSWNEWFSGYSQAFLLWQCGAMEHFPRCHCCFGRLNSRSVWGSEWAGYGAGRDFSLSCSWLKHLLPIPTPCGCRSSWL